MRSAGGEGGDGMAAEKNRMVEAGGKEEEEERWRANDGSRIMTFVFLFREK